MASDSLHVPCLPALPPTPPWPPGGFWLAAGLIPCELAWKVASKAEQLVRPGCPRQRTLESWPVILQT